MLDKLKINPNNPRKFDRERIDRMKLSIRDLPKMLKVRQVLYDENKIVLGGNLRLIALRELSKEGFEVKDEYFKDVSGWTKEEKDKFIIKDNLSFGEWDDEILLREYSYLPLSDYGLNLSLDDEFYSAKIEGPVYEYSGEKPSVNDLVDTDLSEKMIAEILKMEISEEEKKFLINPANRLNAFNYAKIADYYCVSSKEVKEIMEKLGLVIIDYNDAISNGFVEMIEGLRLLEEEDYG